MQTRPAFQKIRDFFSIRREKKAIAELDGLRGIAILLVLARHSTRVFYTNGNPGAVLPVGGWDLLTVCLNGWIGVDLFFVLSGFLIAWHILKSLQKPPFKFGQYFLKRILRIVPAYYAFMLLVALGGLPFYQVSPDVLWFRILYHLLFLQDYLPSNFVTAFWSLGVEEKFYLLAPFLILALLKLKRPLWQFFLLAGLFLTPLSLRVLTLIQHPGVTDYDTYFSVFRSPFHLSLDGLIAGCCCALIYSYRDRFSWTRQERRVKWLFWGGFLLIAVLLGVSPLLEPIGVFESTGLFSVLAVGFGLVVLGCVLLPDKMPAVLRSRGLLFFSKISYSLYLVHMVFMNAVYDGLQQSPFFIQMPLGGQYLVYLLVYSGLSIAGALCLHFVVEKPFLILKDKITTPT